MATPLSKPITREVEISDRVYHVKLNPEPEPCIMFREKGARGDWTTTPLRTLMVDLPNADEAVSRVQESLENTLKSLDDHALLFRDVMSKVHTQLGDEPKVLVRVRDALRDIYVVDLLSSDLSDDELKALGELNPDILPDILPD
jgi:hypothetical protein